MKAFDKKPLSVTRFILKSIRPFYWQLGGLIFVACYWAVHVSLQPYVIKLILDAVSIDPVLSNVGLPVAFYVMLAIGFTLVFRFYDYVFLNFIPPLKQNIIADSSKIISRYSYGFFQNQFSGGITDKIKNLSEGTSEIIQLFFDRFFSHTLALMIACFTLMTVHPMLAVILLAWCLLLIGVAFFTTKKGRLLSHEFSESSSQLIGTIVDQFSNILNVRLFANYPFEEKNLNRKLYKRTKNDQKLRWYLLKVMTVQGLATAGMISACLLVLVFFVNSRQISVGDFGLVLTLTLSFADIMWQFSQEISKFFEVYGLVSQGVDLLNQSQDVKDIPNAKKLEVTKGEIQFQNVHFQYANAEPLFSNKSITLYAGQKVGLVGYSGGGKTTFVNLILRLFEVNSGRILIDTQDIREVTQDSLHHSIGMIPQDPSLFHRSLMDNIRYGRLEASDEEVIAASKKAHAHEFIEILPLGYNALVGERGIKLSGGQRQRIAIARAILKNAPILFLDEATSSLDSLTENVIKNTLMELMENKTTLVIAHRLSTLLHMDRILVFDKGKIVEEGTHAALLKKKGLYKSLWDAQVGGFIPDREEQEDIVETI